MVPKHLDWVWSEFKLKFTKRICFGFKLVTDCLTYVIELCMGRLFELSDSSFRDYYSGGFFIIWNS